LDGCCLKAEFYFVLGNKEGVSTLNESASALSDIYVVCSYCFAAIGSLHFRTWSGCFMRSSAVLLNRSPLPSSHQSLTFGWSG